MSAIENNSVSAQATGPARNHRTTVAQLFLRAVRRWQRQRAINELSRMDDRQLEDIGVVRNDIPRVVEGLFSAEEADARPEPKVDYRGEAATIKAESYRRAA